MNVKKKILAVLMIAIMYMVINIIVDLSYTYLDPRIKEVK